MAAPQHTHNQPEIWKPVVGYEGIYEVSTLGRVYSIKRQITKRNGAVATVGGRILKGILGKSGHRSVTLARLNGETTRKYVHRLVLETFVGPCPEGMEACHWNDIPDDNRLSNLRWASRTDNMYDRSRNGKDNNATKNAIKCARGHAFDEENTIVYSDGHRACRKCKNSAERRRHAEWRAKNPIPERTHCKRGHLLEEPNLRKSHLPRKACVACHRGHAWASHNNQMDNLQAITDSYYEKIVG